MIECLAKRLIRSIKGFDCLVVLDLVNHTNLLYGDDIMLPKGFWYGGRL